jgi:hypothetical protein
MDIRHLMYAIAPERSAEALPAHFTIDQQILASMVGLIAFLLPVVLYLASQQSAVCFHDSISHFYYAPFWGSVLVAMLAMIAAFLLAYRGNGGRFETRFATLAGVAALVVALVPTSEHGCASGSSFEARPFLALLPQGENTSVLAPDQVAGQVAFMLNAGAAWVHYGAALLLFVFLLWYAAVVFPAKTQLVQTEGAGARLTTVKAVRNGFYYLSVAMIATGVGLVVASFLFELATGAPWSGWDAANGVFWSEALALWGFGLGWIVKGRLFGFALQD